MENKLVAIYHGHNYTTISRENNNFVSEFAAKNASQDESGAQIYVGGGFVINNAAILDNRCSDRRAIMPFFCHYQLGIKLGQRVINRRDSKKRGGAAYVDRYTWPVVLSVIGIMILSTMDAFFTFNILAKGGEELNIFMAVLIEDNITKFVGIKLALTALALLLLTIHHNVKLTAHFRVRHLQYMVLTGYATLIGYELHLLELAAMA